MPEMRSDALKISIPALLVNISNTNPNPIIGVPPGEMGVPSRWAAGMPKVDGGHKAMSNELINGLIVTIIDACSLPNERCTKSF